MALRIKVEKKRDYVYTVAVEGSLDTDTCGELEQELREIIDEKTKAVIIDMQNLSYISSAGIRVVIWAKKSLEAQGATFVMTNLQPPIKKVFDVMKILPMLDIFDDMPEADKYISQLIKDELEKQSA